MSTNYYDLRKIAFENYIDRDKFIKDYKEACDEINEDAGEIFDDARGLRVLVGLEELSEEEFDSEKYACDDKYLEKDCHYGCDCEDCGFYRRCKGD